MTPIRLRTLLPKPIHTATPLRIRPATPHQSLPNSHSLRYSSNSTTASRALPKLAQPSFWASVIPKSLRNRTRHSPTTPASKQSKEWNPASFYIVIFILIGSQAIRMIALKNEYTAFTRSTDAKIRLLREVIEKVKSGESVDVERLLGSRDEGKEREWEEVLHEIEREDSLWHQRQKESTDISSSEAKESEASVQSTSTTSGDPVPLPAPVSEKSADESVTETRPKRRVGFF